MFEMAYRNLALVLLTATAVVNVARKAADTNTNTTAKPPTNTPPGAVAAVKQQPPYGITPTASPAAATSTRTQDATETPTEATVTSKNICTCKRSWTSEDGGSCGSTQYGCPSTACDDGSPDSWCIVEDPNCDSGELDDVVVWSYCEPDACVCKDRWTSDDDDGCKTDQYGCPVEACDGHSHTWCIIEDGNCATAEEDDGVSWSYCGTGL